MKRLLRILLTVSTLLSFLLFVGAVAGWVRSQSVGHRLVYQKMIGPIEELRVRRWVLRGMRRSLLLKVEEVRFQPWDADEALALRRDLPSDAGWSQARWHPSLPEEFLIVPGHWGFGLQTFDSSANPLTLQPIQVVRGVLHQVHYHVTALWIPWWAVALLFATSPALAVWRRWRSRAAHPGLCPACGYDLRATPDRCPECGAIPRRPK
jgi:hypothetical protein